MNCHFDTNPFFFSKVMFTMNKMNLTFWYFIRGTQSLFAACSSEVKCLMTAQDSVMGELAICGIKCEKSAE